MLLDGLALLILTPGGYMEPVFVHLGSTVHSHVFVALSTWNVSVFHLNLPACAHPGSAEAE
jgi:hypothetical protein